MIDWIEIHREKRNLQDYSELRITFSPCEFGLQMSMGLGKLGYSHIFPQNQLEVYRVPTVWVVREMRSMAKSIKEEASFQKHTPLKPGEF